MIIRDNPLVHECKKRHCESGCHGGGTTKIGIIALAGPAFPAAATTGESRVLHGLWDFPAPQGNGVAFEASLAFAGEVPGNNDERTLFVKWGVERNQRKRELLRKPKIPDVGHEVLDAANDPEAICDLPCVATIQTRAVR